MSALLWEKSLLKTQNKQKNKMTADRLLRSFFIIIAEICYSFGAKY